MQHSEPVQPQYPEPPATPAADAREGLLPVGLAPAQATVLFVHAHPDDESLTTGAAMSGLARAGAEVHLLTMTRGEMGEVIGPELAHLDVRTRPEGDDGAGLARVREAELREAVAALGIASQRFARREEHPGFFRDSGMSWLPDGTAGPDPRAAEDSLTQAPLRLAATAVAEAIREIRPDVVVTYDADGGYGHPDHRRTHEAVMSALDLLGRGEAPRLVWAVEGEADPGDTRVQAAVLADPGPKREAMAAHRTQVSILDDQTYALSNEVPQRLSGLETFRLLAAQPGAVREAPTAEPMGGVNTGIVGTCLGLLTGFLGTMLHSRIAYADGGAWFPWGVLAALLLVFTGTLWMIHLSQRIWGGMLVGATAFVLVGLFMMLRQDAFLVYPTLQSPIGIAGILWSLGILGVSLLGMWAGRRLLLHTR